MAKKDEVYSEISKRIDSNENDILILRERTHDMDERQGITVAAIEKMSVQLLNIFDITEKLSKKTEEMKQTTDKIKLVSSHWKTILWVILISSLIGFSFETGIRDIIHYVVGEKIASVIKVK